VVGQLDSVTRLGEILAFGRNFGFWPIFFDRGAIFSDQNRPRYSHYFTKFFSCKIVSFSGAPFGATFGQYWSICLVTLKSDQYVDDHEKLCNKGLADFFSVKIVPLCI
jgi:hypothetical protein